MARHRSDSGLLLKRWAQIEPSIRRTSKPTDISGAADMAARIRMRWYDFASQSDRDYSKEHEV